MLGAPGPVQGFANSAVARGLPPGRVEESGTLLSVEVEPIPVWVMEPHFGHVEQFA